MPHRFSAYALVLRFSSELVYGPLYIRLNKIKNQQRFKKKFLTKMKIGWPAPMLAVVREVVVYSMLSNYGKVIFPC